MSGSNSTTMLGNYKRLYGAGSDLFQQNLKAFFYGEIATAPEKPGGEGFFHMTWIRGNESGGAITEEESLKTPQSPQPIQPIVATKIQHWRFQFTGKSQALSMSDKYAFATTLNANLKDSMVRNMSDENRQAFGNGLGTMCLIAANSGPATTFTVDNVQYLRVNQVLDCFVSFGGAQEFSNRTITAIDIATNVVTVDAAVTVTAGSSISKANMFIGAPTDGKELTGLAKIIDTTTNGNIFQGISRVTFPEYQSNVVNAGAVPLSQDLLQRLMDRLMIVGGDKPTMILSRNGVYRSFVNTSLAQTRYQDDVVKAGHVKLTWNGLDWMLDKDCQTGTVYMLNMKPDYLAKYVLKDTDLADLDGKTLDRVSGFDKYEGYYIGYRNLGSKKPNAHGKLINLTEPTF
ncbi:MAG: phage major capsid protein [Acinetobacter sp.]|nr:phage major capsid protein [Acinetobacter sp.]